MVAMAAAATTVLCLLFITLEPCRGRRHILQVLGRSQSDGGRQRDGPRRAYPLAELAGALADTGGPAAAAGAEVVHGERQRRAAADE